MSEKENCIVWRLFNGDIQNNSLPQAELPRFSTQSSCMDLERDWEQGAPSMQHPLLAPNIYKQTSLIRLTHKQLLQLLIIVKSWVQDIFLAGLRPGSIPVMKAVPLMTAWWIAQLLKCHLKNVFTAFLHCCLLLQRLGWSQGTSKLIYFPLGCNLTANVCCCLL